MKEEFQRLREDAVSEIKHNIKMSKQASLLDIMEETEGDYDSATEKQILPPVRLSVLLKNHSYNLEELNKILREIAPCETKNRYIDIQNYAFCRVPSGFNEGKIYSIEHGSINVSEKVGECLTNITRKIKINPKLEKGLKFKQQTNEYRTKQVGEIIREIFVVPYINKSFMNKYFNSDKMLPRICEFGRRSSGEEWGDYLPKSMQSEFFKEVFFG